MIRTPKAISRSYQYLVRGAVVASEKDTFTARFLGSHDSLTPDLFANATALPTEDTTQGGPARNLGIFWTHVIDPTKVNELRFTAQTIILPFSPLASTTSNPAVQRSILDDHRIHGYLLRERRRQRDSAGPRA
ncbi:MAG: hypothetical protein JOZ62_17385 [Acidobacteriaceae bacterium]|nr:hypothetical protein [Acidobacteriaceae bacterium]